MKKSGWILLPAAFFLLINFTAAPVKVLFAGRLVYFLFWIGLFFFFRRFELKRMLPALVGGVSFILFIYGVIQKFVLFPYYIENFTAGKDFYSAAILTRIKTGRIFSLFSLPTLYALVCGVLILFIFHYLIQAKSPRNRLFWLFLLLLGMMNLVLTQSFAGIPYVGIGLLLYLTLSGVLKLNYTVYIVMFLALIFFLVTGLRFSEAKELVPLKMRFSNWEQATRMISTAPFSGKGLGNYEAEITSFTIPGQARSIYAHNFILQLTAEVGIPAMAMLLLMLLAAGKKMIPPVFKGGRIGDGKWKYKDEILYISVFSILVFYNLIDIGFYFFPAALAGVICLSQVYPGKRAAEDKRGHDVQGSPALPAKPTYPLTFKVNAVVLCLLAAILLVENISDTYQKQGDYWLSRQEIDAAALNYRRSIAVNPFNIRSLSMYSYILYFHKHDLANSQEYTDRVLAIYPESPFGCHMKATISLHKREYYQAFYYARLARLRNRFDKKYKELYDFLENHLQAKLPESRR